MFDSARSNLQPILSVEDLERNRVYRLFRAILSVSLGLTALFVVTMLVLRQANVPTLALGGLILALQADLVRRVTPANVTTYSLLMSALFWLAITMSTLQQGMPPTAAALSYVMVVLMVGLLLGWRATAFFAVLSVFALIGLFWLTDRGVLPPYVIGDFRLEAIWLVAVLAQSALVLGLAHHSIQLSFHHARHAQKALEDQNTRLEQEIAEHRRTQQQLLVAERARVEMEKEKAVVETRHRFISMVSHEFRTPLSIILSSKEMLQFYADRMDAAAKEDHYNKISEQVTFMADMLNDVMMVSKAQAKLLECNPAAVNLADFLQATIHQAERQTSTRLHTFQFVNTLPDGMYMLDEKLLKHIVYNLLSNAIKYSPAGGLIRVNVRALGEQIELQVSDQGIGIPQDHLPHLFETFHRAENVGQIQGTGLGLAIVKSGVEAHGGSITVNSISRQGTTFTVYLPLKAAESLALAG